MTSSRWLSGSRASFIYVRIGASDSSLVRRRNRPLARGPQHRLRRRRPSQPQTKSQRQARPGRPWCNERRYVSVGSALLDGKDQAIRPEAFWRELQCASNVSSKLLATSCSSEMLGAPTSPVRREHQSNPIRSRRLEPVQVIWRRACADRKIFVEVHVIHDAYLQALPACRSHAPAGLAADAPEMKIERNPSGAELYRAFRLPNEPLQACLQIVAFTYTFRGYNARAARL